MFSRFIYVVARRKISFLFKAEYSLACLWNIGFPFICGWTFEFAIVTNAAVHAGVQIPVWGLAFGFLHLHLEAGRLDHGVTLFNFVRNRQTTFIAATPFTTPSIMHRVGSKSSPIPPTFFSIFSIIVTLMV